MRILWQASSEHTQRREKTDLKLIIGAELKLIDAPPAVVWATDRKAYGRLSRLLTEGRRRAPKGECFLSFEDLANHHEGLIVGIDPRFSLQSESKIEANNLSPISQVKNLASANASIAAAHSLASFIEYKDVFGDRCYILAELNKEVDDHEKLNLLLRLSNLTRISIGCCGAMFTITNRIDCRCTMC